jgi:hypothetical protein
MDRNFHCGFNDYLALEFAKLFAALQYGKEPIWEHAVEVLMQQLRGV